MIVVNELVHLPKKGNSPLDMESASTRSSNETSYCYSRMEAWPLPQGKDLCSLRRTESHVCVHTYLPVRTMPLVHYLIQPQQVDSSFGLRD